MELSPAKVLEYAKSPEGRKKLRYAGVSVVFVPLGLVTVQLFGLLYDDNYAKASLTASAILTIPNFFANKLYVWKVTSKENQRTQILIFWVAAMLGTTFATVLIYFVQQIVTEPGLKRMAAVAVAQLTGFGIVWVARFLILDRWLFKVTHHGEEPPEEELEELRGEIPI